MTEVPDDKRFSDLNIGDDLASIQSAYAKRRGHDEHDDVEQLMNNYRYQNKYDVEQTQGQVKNAARSEFFPNHSQRLSVVSLNSIKNHPSIRILKSKQSSTKHALDRGPPSTLNKLSINFKKVDFQKLQTQLKENNKQLGHQEQVQTDAKKAIKISFKTKE